MPDVALVQTILGKCRRRMGDIFYAINKKYLKGNVELKQPKGKKKIAEIFFFDPETACIKKEQTGKSLFIIYHRMSCCDGNIAYYNIYKNKLQLYKSEYIHSLKGSKGVAERINSILKKGCK